MRTTNPAILALFLLLLTTIGCSPTPGPSDRQAAIPTGDLRTPSDFAIAATLFVGEAGPADLQPMRFVIQPDGVLRAARGAGVSLDILPPRTRELTQAQLSHIYNLAVREGLDRGIGGSAHTPGRAPAIEEDGALLIVEFTAHDTRRVSAFDAAKHTGAGSMIQLLRQLARIE